LQQARNRLCPPIDCSVYEPNGVKTFSKYKEFLNTKYHKQRKKIGTCHYYTYVLYGDLLVISLKTKQKMFDNYKSKHTQNQKGQ